MKFKHVIVLYLIAWLVLSIGSFFKIQSFPFASEILLLGTALIVIAHFLMIIKVGTYKNPDSFLNK